MKFFDHNFPISSLKTFLYFRLKPINIHLTNAPMLIIIFKPSTCICKLEGYPKLSEYCDDIYKCHSKMDARFWHFDSVFAIWITNFLSYKNSILYIRKGKSHKKRIGFINI